PQFLAIAPPEPGVWLLDASEDPMLLRFPQGLGGAALPSRLETHAPGGLLLALEAAETPPETLRIRVTDNEQHQAVAQWHKGLDALGINLEIWEDTLSRTAWLAREPLPQRGCNLLTGSFAAGEDPWQWGRRMVPMAAMATLLLVIGTTQWFLEGARIRAEHQRLEQAIEATYRKAFPDAKNLVDPRYQMEKRLERLKSAREDQDSGAVGLLDRLQNIAPLITNSEGDLRAQSLRLNGERLSLEVSLPDYEALERLQKRLARKGAVTVEDAELKKGRVRGRIRISGDT
ncbi:MAG: type II secretion system protein GspL, partial [Thiohalorhabdaceae bacterium]